MPDMAQKVYSPMQKLELLEEKSPQNTNGKPLLTDAPLFYCPRIFPQKDKYNTI